MLNLYNSYSRKLEPFKPLKGKTVTMYNCGPTVYDYAHIGNMRSYLFADVLRRYLEYSGYKVKQVMNITDVGHALGDADVGNDKIEEGAKREGLSPLEVVKKFETQFMSDIKRLNIEPAFKYPHASEHVDEMIAIIAKLLKKGIAYEAENDVYFDISKFPEYGKLSGNTIEALEAGARVEVNPKKKNPADFALWIHNPKHLMQWDAPWSRGYPGWHIECTAMSTKYLGETIDIHTGGEDNKFPHHECEIAQTEAATGKPFVRFWLHAAFLMVDGAKMSKSLGNLYRLDEIIDKGYEPRVFRLAMVSSHYRDQQNFTFDGLDVAKRVINKLDSFWTRLNSKQKNIDDSPAIAKAVEKVKMDFADAMDDDLNVSKTWAAIFQFVHDLNIALDRGISPSDQKEATNVFERLVSGVLGIELTVAKTEKAPAEIEDLLKQRNAARAEKDFARADEIRNKIKVMGYDIVDSGQGPEVKKI